MAPVTSSSARRYCGAVAFAGGVLLIGIALDSSASRFDQERTVAILLAAGVLLGELLPLKIPRRGEHEELTVSTSFAFALLLLAGLWPAVAAQSVASVVEDVDLAQAAVACRRSTSASTRSRSARRAWS